MTDAVDPNLARCATCGKYFIQHVEKWSRYATCGKFKDKLEGVISQDKLEGFAVQTPQGQTGGSAP
jgi:hypothetical protein